MLAVILFGTDYPYYFIEQEQVEPEHTPSATDTTTTESGDLQESPVPASPR